jgi:hypothetical protein
MIMIMRFPCPALCLQLAQSAKITVAAAETLAPQSNLLPPQESTTRAAEIRGLLHLKAGTLDLALGLGLLGRWGLVAVHERLRNS